MYSDVIEMFCGSNNILTSVEIALCPLNKFISDVQIATF